MTLTRRELRLRTRRRQVVAFASAAVALLAVVPVVSGTTATAAPGDDLLTTDSTRAVAWAPRHPDDGPEAGNGTYDLLKDWELRVSQTEDLLNQTVQVSWTGAATTGSGTFLQLMQCWSDGPDVPPTREQCAYGGTDVEGAAGSGAGRTRQLSADPRERTYLNDGDLTLAAVDGVVAPAFFGGNASLRLATNSGTCPDGTVSHEVSIVPPDLANPIVDVFGALPGTPPPFERDGRTFAAAAPAFTLDEVAAAADVPWAAGDHRVELLCSGEDRVLARYVTFLSRSDEGSWTRAFREGGIVVPFDPIGDTQDTRPTDAFVRDEILEYVKPQTTNELWQARTRPDGAGSVFMELFTDFEAQHLGCGRPQDSGAPRSCWLVGVPRWAGEPNGQEPTNAELYSPLSQTLWDRRVEVPLGFAPVASGCQIGSGLKQILSNDVSLAALRSWQPTLCGSSATAVSVLGPLQDFTVRAAVSGPNRLGVVGLPELDRPTQVRAPLTTTGLVVAFSLDRRIPFGSATYDQNGTRESAMNLTPRLVAKLLTQSYDSGAAPNGGRKTGYNGSEPSGSFRPVYTPARNFPADNPQTMLDDPEFVAINPDVVQWLSTGDFGRRDQMADLLVTAGDADAYSVLWQWVLADPGAKAFLAGEADPDGMTVNPYYKDVLTAETSTFPLFDPTCVDNLEDPAAERFPLLCQINNHPRAKDDTDAALSAVRGDSKRVNVAPLQYTGNPAELTYRAEARQQQGQSAVLAVTTSAVAERFGLPTAALQNADGAFVTATDASLSAARSQMASRSDGVLVPAPGAVSGTGYPLTTNSYAVVDVSVTTQDQNDAFAALLDYAAGEGQQVGNAVGQLPPGYAPMTPEQSAQTRAAAVLLRDPSSLLPADEPSSGGAGTTDAGGTSGTNGTSTTSFGRTGATSGAGTPATPGTPGGPVAAAAPPLAPGTPPVVDPPAGSAPEVALASTVSTTPATGSSLRWVLLSVLVLGTAAAVAGRVLAIRERSQPLAP